MRRHLPRRRALLEAVFRERIETPRALAAEFAGVTGSRDAVLGLTVAGASPQR
ncbi:hypothetical protein ACFV6Z_00130 [Streptomyces sp. NPDC059818]|uniref:hypothetical protein n=1 Tax=Streptomyces sp. NPDC059818 TaxID=3346962 RepID=UPI003655C865